MSARLDAALAELAAALREEIAHASVPVPNGPDRLLSIPQACEALGGVSRTTLYALIGRGDVRSICVSRRRLIPVRAITEFIARREVGP